MPNSDPRDGEQRLGNGSFVYPHLISTKELRVQIILKNIPIKNLDPNMSGLHVYNLVFFHWFFFAIFYPGI